MEWDEEELEELAEQMGEGAHHVAPHGDIDDHEEARNCWCGPRLAYRDKKAKCEIWAHRFARETIN